MKKGLRSVWICGNVLAVVLVATVAPAAVWTVPGNFPTIQDAIDSASVMDGDVINVGVGEFSNPSGVGYGAQNYAMYIPKELTIQGAGNNAVTGTLFAPFSTGGQATNGVVFMEADNIVFRDIYIDAQKNQDSGTGQEVARGFQTGGGTNLLIENVTVEGTVHSCAEMNNTVDSTVKDFTCDTTVAGYNEGKNSRGIRVVSSDNLALDNVVVFGPAPDPFDGSGRYVVSFQEANSYTLRNASLTGGAQNYGHWIFMPFLPGDAVVTYEVAVAIEDAPIGINLEEDATADITLNTALDVVQFSNVGIPLQRDGLGVVHNLDEFVCLTRIPFRSTAGSVERYFATLAEAQADATLSGGVADEVDCSTFFPPQVPAVSRTVLAGLGLLLMLGLGVLAWRRMA